MRGFMRGYAPIVVILDRERRAETCDDLVSALSALLDAQNHQGRYLIGIPLDFSAGAQAQ